MKDFLEFVVKRLVDKPEAVSIEYTENGRHVSFQLKVAEEDTGKVIGKEGSTAAALRLLLRAISAKQGKRASLEIMG